MNYAFLPLQISTSDLYTFLYIGSFIVLTLVSLLWGARIQAQTMLGSLGRNLTKLETLKNGSRKELLDYLSSTCKVPQSRSEPEVDRILDYFTIFPVDMDPAGLVGKMEQVVRLQDDRLRQEIKDLAPEADAVQQSVAQNITEIASSLSQIYKIIRHFYLIGQKTKNPYVLVQVQMSLPIIVQQAEAFYGAIESLKLAQPIGDGAGAMVAGRLMVGREKTPLARETVYAKSEYKGRTLYVVKAEGPMGSVGMPDVAVQKLTQDPANKISMLIMVDAALKLEGEKTGEISHGVGAAIGGIGTERFRIEEAAVKNNIPMYAVVVKETVLDSMSVMTKDISEAAQKVVNVVLELVEKKTKESDSVLIVGVGNTLGVGQ